MARDRPAVRRLILDSGAVIGWSRGDPRVPQHVQEALARGATVDVPVVVLAETVRGGSRDAPVNRVLKAVGLTATSPATGRGAGALLGRIGGRNTADALVAAEALRAGPGSVVLTSDPDASSSFSLPRRPCRCCGSDRNRRHAGPLRKIVGGTPYRSHHPNERSAG